MCGVFRTRTARPDAPGARHNNQKLNESRRQRLDTVDGRRGALDMPGLQRGQGGRPLDERAPRSVDQQRRGLHGSLPEALLSSRRPATPLPAQGPRRRSSRSVAARGVGGARPRPRALTPDHLGTACGSTPVRVLTTVYVNTVEDDNDSALHVVTTPFPFILHRHLSAKSPRTLLLALGRTCIV